MRTAATVTVSVLSLALVTACSTEESSGSKSLGSESAAPAEAAKAFSASELEKLLLAQGEVKGYQVDSGDDTLPKSKTEVKTDNAQCDPLAWATAGLAPGDTDANASNSVTEDKASTATAQPEDAEDIFDVDVTYVGLSSYEGDGAAQAMKAVSDGVSACSGGYGLAAGGEDSKVTKVSSLEGSGLGEESVAFAEDVDMDGEGTATFHTEVVREGNTIATFYTVNFASFGTGEAAEIPASVVEAQITKLK